ncbi:hypothetical protein [Streptomyces jumonjinensis]|nr:hypothetical protein [Streptomyces jumonjinensis]
MSSPEITAAMCEWRFSLHMQDPLTPEQNDTLDRLDCFNDGLMSLIEGPGYAKFVCHFEATTLTEAITEAIARFEYFPGVLIRSVELDPISLEHNSMATPSVVAAPPRLPYPAEAE